MVEISIIASVGGAAVSAALGSWGTYLFRERSQKKRQAKRVENLRRSLLAELASMDELAQQKSANYATQLPMHSTLSAEVYRSNAADISLLTQREADAVIRYYANALKLEETLDTTRNLVGESEHSQLHDMTPLNESIDVLREEWKRCVLALISELEGYPSKIHIGEEQAPVDDSLSPADLWFVLNPDQIDTADTNIEFID